MRTQINARNRAYQFDTAHGEKILFAGLRQGIDLPYECATGTCGTCKTAVLSGEADHRDMVLTPAERRTAMMVCVSRGRGELVLDA